MGNGCRGGCQEEDGGRGFPIGHGACFCSFCFVVSFLNQIVHRVYVDPDRHNNSNEEGRTMVTKGTMARIEATPQ